MTELDKTCDAIALELFDLSPVKDLVSRLFPKVVSGLSTAVSALGAVVSAPTVKLTGNQREFLTRIKHETYLDIAGISLNCPTSLGGDYVGFTAALADSTKFLDKIPTIVNGYRTLIGSYTNQRGSQQATSIDLSKYTVVENERAGVIEATLTSHLTGKSNTYLPYSRLISRNADWADVLENINTAMEAVNRSHPRKLMDAVNDISELLEIFIKRVESGNQPDPSPEFIQGLAEISRMTARLAETYAVLTFAIKSCAGAIDSNIEDLNALMSR